MSTERAVELLAALVLEDGRPWGEAATEVQWADARAVLGSVGDPSAIRRHWVSRARGYSKTSDLAAMTLVAMIVLLPDGAKAYAVARDRDQARLLVDAMRGFVMRTPQLRGAVTFEVYGAASRGGAVCLEVIPADAAGAWGLLPHWVVIDELCQHPETPSARALWEAVTTSLPKVAASVAVVITTSGAPGHWSREVYEHALEDELWRVSETHGPAPWMDPAELASERARLPESSYLRLFENEWAQSEDRLFDPDDVRSCATLPGELDPVPGVRYAIGVDLALRNDRAAVATCHAEGDGIDRKIVCDRLDVFTPSRHREVDLQVVEDLVCVRAGQYGRADCVFDPAMAWQMMQRLRRQHVRVVEHTFSASSNSRRALALLQLVREHRLVLPEDDELIDELLNLRLVERAPGVYRHDHDQGKHDDRATALGLAALHLLEHGPHTVRFRHEGNQFGADWAAGGVAVDNRPGADARAARDRAFQELVGPRPRWRDL